MSQLLGIYILSVPAALITLIISAVFSKPEKCWERNILYIIIQSIIFPLTISIAALAMPIILMD